MLPETKTGEIVRLLKLDVVQLEDSENKGFILYENFHSCLVDDFLCCLERMGICVESDFWEKSQEQRSIKFEMQPNFLELQANEVDLGVIIVKRDQEILAIFHAEEFE